MGRMSRGWELTKVSLRVVRKDKEILILPILAGLSTILLLAAFVGGLFFTFGFDAMFEGANVYLSAALWIAFYIASFFITIFFNAAMIGIATIRLNGGDPKIKDGIGLAMQNLSRILLWALFAASVGLVIKAIQQRSGALGRIILGGLGVAWTILTYFALPVLIYEKIGPWAAVKRSASIIKSTWGEAIVGNLGLGIIFILLGFAGVLLPLGGWFLGGAVGAITGTIVMIVYWITLAIIKSAAQSVLVAALYRYATTGKVSEDLASVEFANPWVRA